MKTPACQRLARFRWLFAARQPILDVRRQSAAPDFGFL